MALAMLLAAAPVAAQDALRGKRLYLDTAREVGSGVSCVDCHGGLPGGLFGIGRAANDPAAVERAVNSVPQMTPLRGRLSAQDYADVATFIANPGVASPSLRSAVAMRGSAPAVSDRADFGTTEPGQRTMVARVVFSNDGSLAMAWAGSPRIIGPEAVEFGITASSCESGQPLAAGASCEVGVVFQPAQQSSGLRTAALQVDHDWIGGTVAVALLGTSSGSAAMPPVNANGGGGAIWPGLCAAWLVVRRRRRDERPRDGPRR